MLKWLPLSLKVLSYWNLNTSTTFAINCLPTLKVLSYWNLNVNSDLLKERRQKLKVLSYWNLNWDRKFEADDRLWT